MCIPGCSGTGKSPLIRALTKYFLTTKRMQIMRQLAATGITAAEIDRMTIHSFLEERRNSGKPRTIEPGDVKLEKEWRLTDFLLIYSCCKTQSNYLCSKTCRCSSSIRWCERDLFRRLFTILTCL